MKRYIVIGCEILIVAILGSSALASEPAKGPRRNARSSTQVTQTIVAQVQTVQATAPLSNPGRPLATTSPQASANSQAGGLPALDDRVTRLEGAFVLLTAKVGSQQGDIDALKGTVNALQSSVEKLKTAVTDLERENRWAVVNSKGTVIRHSGTAEVKGQQLDTGKYVVTFSDDVNGCAYVASIGDATEEAAPKISFIAPNPGFITVSGSVATGNSKNVLVETFGADGKAADASFHLYVSCP